MRYENPPLPEDINVSGESDAIAIFKLLPIVILGFAAAFAILYVSVRFFAPLIPFSVERAIGEGIEISFGAFGGSENRYINAERELQQLADHLALNMNAPDDMPLNVRIIDDNEANAFAMLGGNIFITTALINLVGSENALAMVLGHEIAHIKNRDPIVMMATTMTYSLFIAMVFGSDAGFLERSVTQLTQASFSRDQENSADKAALFAVEKQYRHTFGAEQFFDEIGKNKSLSIEFLSTHPDTQKRLEYIINSQITDHKKELKPLPPATQEIKYTKDNR